MHALFRFLRSRGRKALVVCRFSLTLQASLLTILSWCASSSYLLAQTRLLPPEANVLIEGPSDSLLYDPAAEKVSSIKQKSKMTSQIAVNVPVPSANPLGLFYLNLRDKRHSVTFSQDSARESRQTAKSSLGLARVGLLHHAAEGAPAWKLEVGRFGRWNKAGYLTTQGTVNLEKAFPVLRPYGSDKLDSWFEIESFLWTKDKTQKSLSMARLGWSWISAEGYLIEVIAPESLQLGLKDEEWVSHVVWSRQAEVEPCSDDYPSHDLVTASRDFSGSQVCLAWREKIAIGSTRYFSTGFYLGFGAGVLARRIPMIEIGVGWSPAEEQ